jgi:NADH-quinone oxidoreductase subunit N
MNEGLADFLRGIAATNEWWVILPEILLAVLALGLLVLELLSPKIRKLVPKVALAGQGLILVLLLGFGCSDCGGEIGQSYFGGLLQSNEWTLLMRVFFLFSALMVTYLGGLFLARQNLAHSEFYHLVILVAAAMMLLLQSNNFVMLFVALEMVTVAFYVLVAYRRSSSLSLEAGIKYLILGAMSSSILLFGIVLLYGVGGNPVLAGATGDALNFDALGAFIALNPDNPLVLTGALLVLAGICFKIGAVPFQIWVPDVYQGAPTPVTAYLAVASKAAGFMVLLALLHGPFLSLQGFLIPVLSLIAGASILFGNIAAVTQGNLKRLLGLSGVAHAGYLLMGVVASCSVEWAEHAVVFYLITYLLASFAVFTVLSIAVTRDDAEISMESYRNLSQRQPFLGGMLTIGLGSLAGIPPLGGFIAKLFLFVAAFQAGLYGLLVVAVVGVVISIYYYFGWIRSIYFKSTGASDGDELPEPLGMQARCVMGALGTAIVLLGVFPGVLGLF